MHLVATRRSPFSNEYFPPLEEEDEPTSPPAHLRALEKFANEMFGYYVRLYYGKAAPCSVYCFDIDGTAFGSCWVVKKSAWLLWCMAANGHSHVCVCVWPGQPLMMTTPSAAACGIANTSLKFDLAQTATQSTSCRQT